jgi:hypothetical protein
MKTKSLLPVLCLLAVLLFGFQVLSPPTTAFALEATVDIKPETINLNREGRWITVHIALPEGYNVSDIDTSTILLEDMFSPEWSNIECGMLMAKFDSSAVINYLWDRLYHMGGNRVFIELTVTGKLVDGTPFTGSDTVTIMDPRGEK